ncbi:MAG: phosphate signaling complex protein PhoU [Pseudonocardiaceae bacterium]
MRATFHAELDDLVADVAKLTRLASRMMNNASIALHQRDLALAGLVIADRDRMTVMLDDTERRCVALLALQAPVAADLRVVIVALRVAGHLTRMADLAQHVAIVVRLKQPNSMIVSEIRPVLARMSLLASQLADDAATAIEHQDPVSGDQMTVADGEVDALRRHLFGILFAEDWSHGVAQAVDAALIGRYYERFADHAMAIAGQVRYLATGQKPEPSVSGQERASLR